MSVVASPLSEKKPVWAVLYAAVVLTASATLILELALTRIFSVVFYYHFAFLAISIAMFGLGAGGVLSYFVPQRGRALFARLGLLTAANAVLVVAALAIILGLGGKSDFFSLGAVYFCAAAPFIVSGTVISLAIAETIQKIDRVYFFDLAGAASGCLLLIPLLNLVGGPGTVMSAAVLFSAAAAVWFGLARSVVGRTFGVALALLLMGLVLYNKRTPLIDIHTAKGKEIRNEVFVEWNSFSRIAVKKDNPGSGLIVAIDADATTGIPQFDLDRLTDANRAELGAHGPGYPYHLRPGAKTLIIGAGGGWDVARAIASGSRDVTGVEINPIISETIMRKRFRRDSRDLYFRPEVRIRTEDGRSFVRRTNEKYQLIQATLVDTWASTAAGAFALSENNLYTVEAFTDYFNHLTPDGLLAFSRWGFDPPRESLRLLSLAREALLSLGERDPWRHVIVVRENAADIKNWGASDTVIFSRKPLDRADVEQAVRAAESGGFELLYTPGGGQSNAFASYLLTKDLTSFYRGYQYDVRPVPDDRPFFFYTVQPDDLRDYLKSAPRKSADYKINLAVPTLFGLLGVSLLATLLALIAPPVLLGTRLPREPGVPVFLLYFASLGIGYTLIQVGSIQKLVLLLGHPTYALTVVIFSMLLCSGAGSYFSRRVVAGGVRRLLWVLAGVTVLVAVLAVLLEPVAHAVSAWRLGWRLALAVGLLGPPAFLMGMPFPSGLDRMAQWHPPSVRWAWSLNAASSVLGSCLAIFLALYAGLRNTILLGALAYAAAAIIVHRASRTIGARTADVS